ncbi:unnamed protein product [Closterium sp. NIES-54]
MASLRVRAFYHEGGPVPFDTWLDNLQLYLLIDSKDSVSLLDLVSGAATAPPATADSSTRSQWLTRNAATRLAIHNHLPLAECAHFGQHRTAQALYDAIVACYSSPAIAALGRLLLPYLFPELSAFTTVEDLVSHLRASDAHYRAAVPAEDHFLSIDSTSLPVDLLEQHLLTAETCAVAVGAARGTPRLPFFEGCSPSPLAPSYASAAAADVSVPEDVGAASASVKRRSSKGKGGWSGGGGSGGGGGGSGSGSGGSSGGGGGGGTVGGSGGSGGGGGGSSGGGGSGGGGTGSGGTGAWSVSSGGGQRQQQQQRRSETPSPQQLRRDRRGRGGRGLRGEVSAHTACLGGAEPEGVEPEGVASEGAEPQGAASSGGSAAGGAGAARAGGPRVAAGAGVTGGTATTGPGGARTRGTCAGGAGAGGTGAAEVGAVDPGVGGFGDTPASPLPAPSPYIEQSGGLTKRREPASRSVSPVRTSRRVPCSRPPSVPGTHAMSLHPSTVPLRVPLPPPPESSLPEVPEIESDRARAASPTVSRLFANAVIDPSFESTAASALVAELLDFAATCRLDYASALVSESKSASLLSVGGECALSTDVLEDKQEDFESLAAAVPRFASMLLAPEGDPDAPDIPTPRSYAEAIMGPYFSQWQAAMDAEMASWKSTGT